MTTAPQPASVQPAPAKPGLNKRWMIAILALTFLFVLMPFLFWQATWFGRPLSVDQLRQSLADTEQPREIQHALSQIADRILAPDEPTRQSARQFYPAVAHIAESDSPELRLTAAWVMGQDNTVPEFHQQLSRLLRDPNPMVRRNAALGLVRFGDASGHDEICALLAPYPMPAPYAGIVETRLRPDDAVNPGTLLGHIRANGQESELRASVPGTLSHWLVADGSAVNQNQPVVVIDPSPSEVFEALRALYLIGRPDDLPAVEQFLHGGSSIPANVRQQAEQTAEAIRSRPRQASSQAEQPLRLR